MPPASHQAATALPVPALHGWPPTIASGRSAPSSSARARASSAAPGAACAAAYGDASGTSAVSARTSSGSASTTGPGRPEVATRKARAVSSGMRSTWSTCATHFASGPNMRR